MFQNTELEIEKIQGLVNLSRKNVLEIGCGDGRISKLLVSKVKKLVAIDPDKKKIAKVRRTIKDADFQVGKGEKLNFKDASFDIVVFSFSLHHHQDFEKALAESQRVLKEGGKVLAIEPTEDGEVEQYFNIFEDETRQIKAAEVAIKKSSLKLLKKEIFTEIWTFDNLEDLHDYFFKFHKKKSDNETIRKIENLLGKKKNLQPIFLKDKIAIFLLGK